MAETRFYEPARLSISPKPLFSLKPLDATTCLRSVLSKVFEKWLSRLFEDEIAEFLTKTERAKSMNTQNILPDECYILVRCYPTRPSALVDNILLPQSV